MGKKLVKLSDTHYIVVDDSEIKKCDKYLIPDSHYIATATEDITPKEWGDKITHSTQPLEKIVSEDSFKSYEFISLSDVEEAINGYSAEKMAKSQYSSEPNDDKAEWYEPNDYEAKWCVGYVRGFNAYKELVKDKVFSIDDVAEICSKLFKHTPTGTLSKWEIRHFVDFVKNTIKTEWEVEFDEHGKLKTIQ